MTTRRTPRRGAPPPIAEPPPLIETHATAAIKILEGQYDKIKNLDPSDQAAVQDAQSFLFADVERVFGVGSAECLQIAQNNIINEPEYLRLHYL